MHIEKYPLNTGSGKLLKIMMEEGYADVIFLPLPLDLEIAVGGWGAAGVRE